MTLDTLFHDLEYRPLLEQAREMRDRMRDIATFPLLARDPRFIEWLRCNKIWLLANRERIHSNEPE